MHKTPASSKCACPRTRVRDCILQAATATAISITGSECSPQQTASRLIGRKRGMQGGIMQLGRGGLGAAFSRARGEQSNAFSVHRLRNLVQRNAAAAVLALMSLAGAALAQAVNVNPPNLSGGMTGGIQGNEVVLPDGGASYSIPLQVPPGTAGLAPVIGLTYVSRAEDGLLGRGWSVAGLSKITRCGKTIAQDGVRRGVDLTNADQFCLDGQRLMLQGGSHGVDGVYRTELDQFSRIETGQGTTGLLERFVVRSKDGFIHTYGGTPGSRLRAQGTSAWLIWALSRVEDRRGNYYDVDYDQNEATGELYPIRIRYTGNVRTAQPTYNAVRLIYETRPDPWSGYVMGSVMQRNRRLVAIRTVKNTDANGDGGSVVRDYRISYAASPTSGRSLVSSVMDCDGAGACLPATNFSWTTRDPAANTANAAGSGIWGGPSITIESTSKQPIPSEQIKAKTIAGDFNGDGATDLLYADGGSNWKVCLAAKTTFNCQTWTAVAGRSEEAVTGDFNGDGLTDIALLPTAINTVANYTVCLSTGSGFQCQSWSAKAAGQSAQRYLVADIDGDGRDDLLVLDFYGGYLCRSNGAGFDACSPYDNLGAALASGSDPELRMKVVQRMGDLNGDGRVDVIKFNMGSSLNPFGNWTAYVAGDTGFVAWPSVPSAGIALGSLQPGQSLVADYNADAYGEYGDTAAVVGTQDPNMPVMEVCKSTGRSLICSTRPYSPGTQMPFETMADVDRDGKIDGLGFGRLCQISDTAVTPCTAMPAPDGPGPAAPTLIADFNGDGIPDKALYEAASGSTPGRWYVRLTGAGGYVDLLERIDEGGGRAVRFAYAGLDDPTVHDPGPLVQYPTRRMTVGLSVVARMETSNGSGGWLSKDYRYDGAKSDLLGRGPLGFARMTEIDQVRNITTVTVMSQAFPYVGMATSRTSTHANGVMLSQSTSQLATLSTGAGIFYPYVKTVSLTERDLDGTPLPTVVQGVDDAGVDAYGNVTSATETITEPSGEVWQTRTTAQYDNRVQDWLLGLKTRQQVTKTAPGTVSGIAPPALTLNCSAASGAVAPSRDVTNCKLGNAGQVAAAGIVYSAPSGTSISGPASCDAGTSQCGTVTVQSSAAPGQYTGVISAAPASGTPATANVSLSVLSPATLILDSCSANSGTVTPTPASFSCRVRNAGQVAAQSIAYGGVANSAISGPAGRCEAGAVCGTVSVTTATGAGNYAGTLTATPDAGVGGSVAVNLWVYTPGQLVFGNCSVNSPTVAPAAASMTCTLTNTGQTAISSINYGVPNTVSVAGPTGACAAGAQCGIVTVTSGTGVGTYVGTLTATPNTGGAAQAAVNLTVLSPPQIALSACTVNSPTTTPSAASLTCTVSNTGQAAASALGYGAISGASVTGPTGACAGGSNCGTVTVTTSGNAGTYGGTLLVSPNAGGSASMSVDLRVLTQSQLVLGSCSSTTPTTAPTAATLTCTLTNVGQTATSSIGYGAPGGTTVAGPTGACGAGAQCGTVTLSTSTAAGTYTGTLTATPAGGVSGSATVNLQVYPPPPSISTNPAFPLFFSGRGLPTYNVNVTANVANGLAPFSYQWSVVSSWNTFAQITNGTSATASLSTQQTVACESGAAVYRVVVTDALGRTGSIDMTMNMRSTSPPPNKVCP